MIYLFIFICKILENSIGTLRLIIVSNGKKLEGAILNFILSLIWIISTSLVVLNNNIYKILIFAIGSLIGSYVGSLLEEKIALGNNMLFVVSKKYKKISKLENTYLINKDILMIMVKRKKRKEIIDKILNIDNKAIIISESAKQLVFK
ncbi:MAG TPA: hypothetical protein IAC20_02715 [Candidatus Faecisoma merdavium]|nr:hypothetical protein [Candidatus Faecisoma merdavium]